MPEVSPPIDAMDDALRRVLAGFPQVCLAVLFGSVASGRARADSDLDLAVSAQPALSVAQTIALTQALAEQTGRPVDLVDLKTAPEPLLGQIVRHGRRLMGSDTLFGALIYRHLIDQADFMPWRPGTCSKEGGMDREVVEQKLESLRRCLHRVQSKCPDEPSELVADFDLQDIVALNLSRAVQLAVDIGAHLVAGMDVPSPGTMG